MQFSVLWESENTSHAIEEAANRMRSNAAALGGATVATVEGNEVIVRLD